MAGKLSKPSLRAAAYLKDNPDISAPKLAKKFGLALSSVYGAAYWKAHRAKQLAAAPKAAGVSVEVNMQESS